MAEIRTRRWDDPVESGDGTRILVSRYRPRGLPKTDETWQEWMPNLGPSKALHAAAYGKNGLQMGWDTYRVSYLREMQAEQAAIATLAKRVDAGETVTLLCSSSCLREARCHRSLLKALLEAQLARRDAADA